MYSDDSQQSRYEKKDRKHSVYALFALLNKMKQQTASLVVNNRNTELILEFILTESNSEFNDFIIV